MEVGKAVASAIRGYQLQIQCYVTGHLIGFLAHKLIARLRKSKEK